jgi:beta-glucosidase
MGQSEDVETIFESISHQFGSKVKLVYEPGVDFDGKDKTNIDRARRIASQSDLVIAVLGEKSEWSGENGSRSSIALPAIQEDLLSELKKTGKPIVLILSSGRPLELIRIHEKVDAMIQMWQPGTMGAKALTDILTGKINPSGKLAITFPLTTGQIPIHYNRRQSARPFMGHYQDVPKEPLYPFGHGLSYTTFEYDSIQISKSKISMDEKLEASITVSNTGTRAGKESVLWFISDPVASISRPMKELKHFEKKMIPAGEQRTYKFTIDPNSALVFPDVSGKKLLEPGQYHIQVNNQKIEFELVE